MTTPTIIDKSETAAAAAELLRMIGSDLRVQILLAMDGGGEWGAWEFGVNTGNLKYAAIKNNFNALAEAGLIRKLPTCSPTFTITPQGRAAVKVIRAAIEASAMKVLQNPETN